MNRAETYALEQPWVSGPFRWPGEVDLRKWDAETLAEAALSNQEAVLKLLKLGGEMQARSVSDCLNISYSEINEAIRGLALRGLIRRANKSLPYLWVAA